MAHVDQAMGEFSGLAFRMNQESDPPGRWTPSPLLLASGAVHLGAAAAAFARPRAWPWALGAVVLNHVALAAAGLWPRSQLLGPNWTRLPARAGITAGGAFSNHKGAPAGCPPQTPWRARAEPRCLPLFF